MNIETQDTDKMLQMSASSMFIINIRLTKHPESPIVETRKIEIRGSRMH